MKIILLLLLVSFGINASTTSLPKADTTRIGTGTDVDLTLVFNNGLANKPFIRYDSVTNKFVQSSDGVAEESFGTQLTLKGNMVGFGTETEECVLDKTNGNILTVDSTATCGFDFKAPADGTLQGGYDVSTQPQIVVDGTNLGMQIRDALVSIADKLFEVLSNDGLTNFFSVDTNGIALENGVSANGILDEDNLVSDSATSLATQQSIKAYVDASTPLTTDGDIYGFDSGSAYAIPGSTCVNGEYLVRDELVAGRWKCSSYLQGTLNAISDWENYVPAIQGLGTISANNTEYRRVGDSIEIRGKFTAGTTNGSEIQIGLPSSLLVKSSVTISQVGRAGRGVSASNDYTMLITGGDSFLNMSTVGNLVPTVGTSLFGNGEIVSFFATVPIEGWSNGLNGIVEAKTLDATTANELSARISGSGVITSYNYDFIDNVNKVGTGTYDITFNTGVFTVTPSIQAETEESTDQRIATVTQMSSTFVRVVYATTPTGSQEAKDFNLIVIKQGADVNKNVIQAATLQGINSSDIIKVSAAGNAAQPITVNTTAIPFIAIDDIQGNWDGDELVPTKNGRFSFSGSVYFNGGLTRNIYISVNRQSGGYADEELVTNNVSAIENVFRFEGNVDLIVGDRAKFVSRSNGGTLLNDPQLHYLKITQSADYEAIVKNLSLESDRCQTKYLSANHSTASNISELTFNNLIVGKKYKMHLQVLGSSGAYALPIHNGVYLAQAYGASGFAVGATTRTFTATSSTVEVVHGNTVVINGNGGADQTWAELCYKGNTVTTTEFN